jgi:hypothetical protein
MLDELRSLDKPHLAEAVRVRPNFYFGFWDRRYRPAYPVSIRQQPNLASPSFLVDRFGLNRELTVLVGGYLP